MGLPSSSHWRREFTGQLRLHEALEQSSQGNEDSRASRGAALNFDMADFTQLDNSIWNALTTVHTPMARVNGLAIRYPSRVTP